jgi:AcrR family transcriptional regulator
MAGQADGQSKSQRTRAAILAAAREQFAAVGFQRATIRSIAAAAEIDPAMVMRYFGSKAGLFTAATDIKLGLPVFEGGERSEIAARLTRHFVSLWESKLADEALIASLRNAATDERAAAGVRRIFAEQVAAPLATALGGPDIERRAALIGSQMLGMALCRYILRIEPLASATPEQLVAALEPTVRHYLEDPLG